MVKVTDIAEFGAGNIPAENLMSAFVGLAIAENGTVFVLDGALPHSKCYRRLLIPCRFNNVRRVQLSLHLAKNHHY